MKRIFTITFTLVALLMGFVAQAQNRYLQEIYTDADIEVTSNVVYGTNINFLTSTLNNPANIGRDLTEIMTNILTGQTIPSKFYNPGDNTTDVKVTDLKLDIYKPNSTADTATNRPVIIYLHTGNFLPPPINGSPNGTKNDSLAIHMCRSWAKRGYVAVSVEYRLGWNPLAATVQERRGQLLNAVYRAIHDTKKAVRSLKDDATNYGIDPEKISLFGEGTGAYVALAYATLDKYPEMELPKFTNPLTGKSYIDTATVGRIEGFGGLLNLYPPSSTSTSIKAVITVGGALADTSWIQAGDVPMIAFHTVRDPFAPFDEGTVIVPTTNQDVVEVQGANIYIDKAVKLGNNDAFKGMPGVDPYTQAARAMYGKTVDYIYTAPLDKMTINENVEGLFPVIRPIGASLLQNEASPWQWWDPQSPLAQAEVRAGVTAHMASMSSNPDMSPTKGRTYADTILGYSMPRLAIVLGYYNSNNVSVNNIAKINASIAPNPTQNSAVITFDENTRIEKITVMDISGRIVNVVYHQNNNVVETNLSTLSNGLYFIQAETNNGIWAGKIIKN